MQFFWFFTMLLLFTPVWRMTEAYALTWGGVVALVMVFARLAAFDMRVLLITGAAALYQIVVYGLHIVIGSPYAIDFQTFLNSYLLWVTSAALLSSAMYTRASAPPIPVHALLMVLTGLGLFQFVMARVYGNTIGFDLVAPLTWYEDIYDTYLRIAATDAARAIGTYYEPSIFGRIIVTLAAMMLVMTRKPWLPLAYMVVNAVATQSVGTMFLGMLVVLVWYGRPSSQWVWLAILLGVATVASYGFLAARISNDLFGEGSTYTRLIGPWSAIGTITREFLIGAPVSTNEVITEYLLQPYGYRESVISNGLYEFLLYSGIPGMLLVLIGVARLPRLIVAGDKQDALSLMMVLVGTVVSSSFLAIESSLLFYIFIVTMRRDRELSMNADLRAALQVPPPTSLPPQSSIRPTA